MAMTLAVFAKETSILFAIGLAVWLLLQRRIRASALLLIIPAAAYGAWLVYLEQMLGGAFRSDGNLALPFAGIFQEITDVE